ncbi:Heme-based aerotactic transducer HemAT [Paenibacillus solanacearum]|uniref:Heme-based aerotactic transducer HemAT n=1 Tax=Paenibacillus solanacearum TaxID=2048548 RepID=A0A916NUG4_9BACL|nr:globin-coupled sensor protein [Paenibacillus solanacearum]CAG7597223.1 Heme-based aerotactic transducer HemAT [Paenibacillus solanacearum]
MSTHPFQTLAQTLGFSSRPKTEWLDKAKNESVRIRIEANSDTVQQMKMINLQAEDLHLLKAIQPLIHEHIDEITTSFYQTVLDVGTLEDIIKKHSSVDRLKKTLHDHLIEMFNGSIDAEFINKRLQIAKVHQKIGLEPKWYMGAFQNLQNTLLDVIHRSVHNYEESLHISKVITKLLNFEQQLVLEAYEKENTLQREQAYIDVKNDLKGKITVASEELAALTEQTSASVKELVTSSDQVNRSFLHSIEKVSETQTLASEGKHKLLQLSERIVLIRESALLMRQTVDGFQDSFKQIQNIITMVQEIANQTKLLSLNASIEAARAGEHGKGFDVVAKEVQKLSNDTTVSVSQITGLIKQTMDNTADVVASIQKVNAEVEAGAQESSDTRTVFDHILTSMQSNMNEINRVEKEIQSLAYIIEEIGDSTHKVAASAETLVHNTKNI